MSDVFQPADKVVEVSVQGTYEGQLVENKFYAKAVEAITSTMVNEIATIAEDWVGSTLLALLPPGYVHSRSIARDLTVEASFESIDASQGGNAGTNTTSGGLPGNVTFAIHRNTGLSGKKAKSRLYWPAMVAGMFAPDADTVSSAAQTAMISAYETLREAILAGTSATWSYGYLQRILDHVKLSAANFIAVFGHSATDNFSDSQRRRLKGRGV